MSIFAMRRKISRIFYFSLYCPCVTTLWTDIEKRGQVIESNKLALHREMLLTNIWV